ncbi:hypothetical protein HP532_17415 [Pseudomonas sp. CrR25]|nr:hypothetical protein [Pseudomonas sp. CrR25]
MSALRSHTRQAGLMANLIALALLTLPLPTHAAPLNSRGGGMSGIGDIALEIPASAWRRS